MIAITPFLFLICLPFATDDCTEWDLQFTPEGEQVNEHHYVRSYPYGTEFGIDYHYKTITIEGKRHMFDGDIKKYNLSGTWITMDYYVYLIMEDDLEYCTYCGKMSFHGGSFGRLSGYDGPAWPDMTEDQRRHVLGMPEKPVRPEPDYPIWYQEKYAKDRNIFYN